MANRPPFAWTVETEDALRRLWAAGSSCSQIAEKLRAPSRNAIAGKAMRLGLRRRPPEAAGEIFRRKSVAPAARKTPTPVAPNTAPSVRKAAPVAASPPPVPLLALSACHCRWPIGDPSEAGFGFCSAPKITGKPYCAAHWARAWAPAKTPALALARSLRRYI